MAKIDVSWPCYTCISAEYVTALIDKQQYNEALAFLDDCDKALISSGQGKDTSELLQNRISILIKQSRFSEARKLSKQLHSWGGGSAFEFSARMSKAKIDAFDGQGEQALKYFPAFDEVLNDPSEYCSWCEIAHQLVKLDKLENNWLLGKQFEKIILTLHDYGAVREAIDSAFLAADLAILRNRKSTVAYLVEFIQNTIPELHRLCGADKALASLIKRVEENTFSDVNITANDAFTSIQETISSDPELAFEYITSAGSQLANEELDCLLALGRRQQAIARAYTLLEEQPNSPEVLLKLNELAGNDTTILNKFVTRLHQLELNQENQQHLLSAQAKHYCDINEYEKAKSLTSQLLELDSAHYSARRFLAHIEKQLENYEEALTHTKILLEQFPEEKELHWDLILFSSLLENWDDVITSAAQLEVTLAGDGPEYGEWELCRIQTTLADGRSVISTAQRVGPVSARVISVTHSDYPQHYQDLIIFDPLPLNELSEVNEEGDPVDHEGEHTFIYSAIKTMTSQRYSNYFLQGVRPSADELETLKNQLDAQNITLSLRHSDDYEIYDYDTEEYVPGFFAYILLTPDANRAEISTLLAQTTQSFAAPIFWLTLAKEAQQEQLYQEQMKRSEDYDFEE